MFAQQFLCNFYSTDFIILPYEMASPCTIYMQKSSGFGGLRPLDPHRGVAPGPHQGPLSGPLDPRPWGASAPLATLVTLRHFSGN